MSSVAHWGIFDQKGRQRLLLKYGEKTLALQLIEEYNAKEIRTGDGLEKFYLTLVKIEMTQIPRQIVRLVENERSITGFSEDDNGEKRKWTKSFLDVEITSLVDGKFTTVETATSHTHRKATRIIYGGQSLDVDDFSRIARSHWPDHWETLIQTLI